MYSNLVPQKTYHVELVQPIVSGSWPRSVTSRPAPVRAARTLAFPRPWLGGEECEYSRGAGLVLWRVKRLRGTPKGPESPVKR